jgi:2-desacetyl-2-hydroxyethyl bacteriochlorophyllide A dehydrogenase
VLAVVLPGDGQVRVEEIPDPVAGPGEALLDVLVAGICGTDLQLARGYMGFRGTPGHEFVGEVREVSAPSDRVLIGSRVVGEINLGCTDCSWCSRGMTRHCPRRSVLGILSKQGAFASRLTMPVASLRVVPASLATDEAVFAEPLAAALQILDQIRIERSDRVLVLGDGRLGLLAAQVIARHGAAVRLLGRHAGKLEVARGLGLDGGLPEEDPKPVYDVVVEATGAPAALDEALRWCRPRGTVVMKSTCAGAVTFDAARAVVHELTLIGSRCGRLEPAIEALAAGAVRVAPLVSADRPLSRAAEAFELARGPEALKVLLRPGL